MALIRLISDLHLDGCMPAAFDDIGADAVIIAGDSVNGRNLPMLVESLEKIFPEPRILAIPGNHEGYRLPDFEAAMEEFSKTCEGSRVEWLHRKTSLLPGGVAVLGATLWTDFNLFGARRRQDSMSAAQASMMDYSVIGKGGGSIISPDDTAAWHERDLRWIASTIEEFSGMKIVCATHHGVSRQSLALRYAADLSSGGFVSEIDASLVGKADLWLHGHTHTNFDYRVGKCRVVCNPRGYSKDPEYSTENPMFNKSMAVEL